MSEQIISHEHYLWIVVVSISTAVVTALSAVPRELLLLRGVGRQEGCRSTTDMPCCWKFFYTVSSGFFVHLFPVLLFEISCFHIQRQCDKDASSLVLLGYVEKRILCPHTDVWGTGSGRGNSVNSSPTPDLCLSLENSRGPSPQWSWE